MEVWARLGIDIPDKREWRLSLLGGFNGFRKGMPSWWTSIPPASPEEEAEVEDVAHDLAVHL